MYTTMSNLVRNRKESGWYHLVCRSLGLTLTCLQALLSVILAVGPGVTVNTGPT